MRVLYPLRIGINMPLKPLTPALNEALGKINNLANRYEKLYAKSQKNSLKEDAEAKEYMNLVQNRYRSIKATSPKDQALRDKKESYLRELRENIIELSKQTFTKPGDMSLSLTAVDVPADEVVQIIQQIEQPGGHNDLAILACTLLTSESLQTSLALEHETQGCHHHHYYHHH